MKKIAYISVSVFVVIILLMHGQLQKDNQNPAGADEERVKLDLKTDDLSDKIKVIEEPADPNKEMPAEPEMDIDPVGDEIPEDDNLPIPDEHHWGSVPPSPPPNSDCGPKNDPPIKDFPVPVGGFQAILDKLVYPDEEEKAGIEGRVVVAVHIGKDGTVLRTKIVKAVSPGLDQAAIDAIKAVKWIPAEERDKPVAGWAVVPIYFKLKTEE